MKINRETLNYLEHDIKILVNELASIDSEIESLVNKRSAIEWKLSVFREKLKEHGHGAPQGPQQFTIGGELGDSEGSQANGSLAGLAGLGMRDALRQVLSASPKAMKTGDIAAALRSGGFKYSGSVDITTRISNELSRMARGGHVKRSKRQGKLYFSMPNQGGE